MKNLLFNTIGILSSNIVSKSGEESLCIFRLCNHHQSTTTAKISLTFSFHSSIDIGHCVCTELMNISFCWLTLVYSYVGGAATHRRTSLILLQCPVCIAHLTRCMVCEIRDKWPYSSFFVGCSFQDLLKIAQRILMQYY